MKRSRKKHPQPSWIKDLPPGIVGHGPARLYFYLCAGGPNTCSFWNFRLAREFHVCRRTLQYWLQRLEGLALITIEKRQSPYRRIHPVYYHTAEEFIHGAQAKKIRSCIAKIGKTPKFHYATSCVQDLDKRIHYNSLTSKGCASKLTPIVTKTAQAPRGLPVQDRDVAEFLAHREEKWRETKAAILKKTNKTKRRHK